MKKETASPWQQNYWKLNYKNETDESNINLQWHTNKEWQHNRWNQHLTLITTSVNCLVSRTRWKFFCFFVFWKFFRITLLSYPSHRVHSHFTFPIKTSNYYLKIDDIVETSRTFHYIHDTHSCTPWWFLLTVVIILNVIWCTRHNAFHAFRSSIHIN